MQLDLRNSRCLHQRTTRVAAPLTRLHTAASGRSRTNVARAVETAVPAAQDGDAAAAQSSHAVKVYFRCHDGWDTAVMHGSLHGAAWADFPAMTKVRSSAVRTAQKQS
jgi:hypothetical protein